MAFAQRVARDACFPMIAYTRGSSNASSSAITSVTVYTESNECEVPIPVTIPGGVVDAKGSRIEQIGTDPETLWVQLDGEAITFDLSVPIS